MQEKPQAQNPNELTEEELAPYLPAWEITVRFNHDNKTVTEYNCQGIGMADFSVKINNAIKRVLWQENFSESIARDFKDPV
jgi:hypothetical protein